MVELVKGAGFERAGHKQTWQWAADVYVRS